MKALIEKARGGVLLIDEAYGIVNPSSSGEAQADGGMVVYDTMMVIHAF